MTLGLYTVELHLPGSQSLKAKRQVLRRVKDRLRARHNVAVSELEEHAELWQRAGIAVVSIANHRDALDRLFEAVYEEMRLNVPGEIIENGREFFDLADGANDWEDVPS